MTDWEAQVALVHYRELLGEAEVERLAHHLTGDGHSLFRSLRLRVGEALIALGRRMAPEVSLTAYRLELPADLGRRNHNSVS